MRHCSKYILHYTQTKSVTSDYHVPDLDEHCHENAIGIRYTIHTC